MFFSHLNSLIVKFFSAKKVRIFFNLEKLEDILIKIIFLRKKRFHPFKRLLLTKLEGGKDAGGCWPSY